MALSRSLRDSNFYNREYFRSHAADSRSNYFPEDRVQFKAQTDYDPLDSHLHHGGYPCREWTGNRFSVGCQNHSLETWKRDFHKIANRYAASDTDRQHAWHCLQLVLVRHGYTPMSGTWNPRSQSKKTAKKATKKKVAKKKVTKRARR